MSWFSQLPVPFSVQGVFFCPGKTCVKPVPFLWVNFSVFLGSPQTRQAPELPLWKATEVSTSFPQSLHRLHLQSCIYVCSQTIINTPLTIYFSALSTPRAPLYYDY
jgi:hypothetical protein